MLMMKMEATSTSYASGSLPNTAFYKFVVTCVYVGVSVCVAVYVFAMCVSVCLHVCVCVCARQCVHRALRLFGRLHL